jgi:hypothetical protein
VIINIIASGDDLVIAHDELAKSYIDIMTDLGLSINLSKSVVSNEIAEFAKV